MKGSKGGSKAHGGALVTPHARSLAASIAVCRWMASRWLKQRRHTKL